MSTKKSSHRSHTKNSSENFWSGFLFGIGLIAFIDEVVFHQLLHWHHFYDRSTTSMGLISDGLFHAFSWFATVGALFLVARLRQQKAFLLARWIGGLLLGGGFFQLYDGIIQHKLLKIHQIRYVDHLFIYDFIWNLAAIVILAIGIILERRTRNA